MPKLASITVKGFKSIREIALELRDMNIVIGANGAGKSNFIGVFKLVQALGEERLKDFVLSARGADKLLFFGAKTTQRIELELSFGSGRIESYAADLSTSDGDALYEKREHLEYDDPATTIPADEPPQTDQARDFWRELWRELRTQLAALQIYHFHDTSPNSALRRTNELNDNRLLRSDGSNLVAYLYYLRQMHPVEYSLILRTIQRVAPFLDDFILEPLRLNNQTIQLEWRHVGSDAYFDVAALSDGTLRFIALTTLFLQPESLRPSLILVDEPEIGLHPAAIGLLASLMKQASVKSQVIVATQSASLVDHFEPEDVLVAERHQGSTTIRRLETAPLEAWLESYGLGQLWEKNELGGRPQGE